jgi:cell division protein FtsZ
MIEFTPRNGSTTARNIKIIGIGGAGANALDRMALDGVDPGCLIAANTEAQALVASVAGEKVQLGAEATRGLGSGGDPELGRCAAGESAAEIRSALEGAEAVFVIAGLGGGTGSGAAPIVAELARETGALVIALVTLPFGFEGKRRAAQARESLAALQQHADAILCFENDRMGDAVAPKTGIQAAFAAADLTLSQCVLGLAGLLNRNGLIHLGFDELASVLHRVNARCLFGYGEAEGSNRSYDALARALKNPLMDKGRMLRDCETVLVQVTGGPDLTLDEVQLLMEEFNRYVNDSTRICFGAAVDPELAGRIVVTILSSVGNEPAAVIRPKPQAQQPAPVLPKPVPAPVEIPAIPDQKEEMPEPIQQVEALAEKPEAEPQVEEPVVAPAAPRPVKPRGLRLPVSQASLFGEEEETPSKIAPPVPGRMLDRPYPKMPAPVEKEPEIEPQSEAIEIEPEPIPEIPMEEASLEPEPEAVPEPKPAFVRPERRPLIAPKPRAAEPNHEAVPQTGSKTPQQEILQFEPVTRGRFEKSEPTIVDGQDLDVPTYLRRRVKLR